MAHRLQSLFGTIITGVVWLVPISMVLSLGAAHVTARRIRARHPQLTESMISALMQRYPQLLFLYVLVELVTPGNITKAIQIFRDQWLRDPYPLGLPYLGAGKNGDKYPLPGLYAGLGDWDYIYSEAAALLQERFSSKSKIYKPSVMLPQFAAAHPALNMQQWMALKPVLPVPEIWLDKEYSDHEIGIPAAIQEFIQAENRPPVPLKPYWDSFLRAYTYNMEGLADWSFIYNEVNKDKPAENEASNPRYDLKSTAELLSLLSDGKLAAQQPPSREAIRKVCRAQQLKFAPDKMVGQVTTGEDIKAAAVKYQQINEICKELELRFPRK